MKRKRVLSIVLALCLVVGLMPAMSLTAAAAESDKAIMWGVSGISNYDSTNGYDYVYYGAYPQSEYTPIQIPSSPTHGEFYTDSDGTKFVCTTYHGFRYFKIEPIKWRVLDKANSYKESENGDTKTGLFVLSDIVLESPQWNVDGTRILENYDYGKSDIRDWLNYTESGNFLTDAFSTDEQAGIATTYVETTSVEARDPVSPQVGSTTITVTPTADQLFLLSNEDVSNTAYGFKDDLELTIQNGADTNRASGYSDYAEVNALNVNNGNAQWWLRSPGSAYGDAVPYAQATTVYEGNEYMAAGSVDSEGRDAAL